MTMVTKQQIDEEIARCRLVAAVPRKFSTSIIVALADDNDRLRAQLAKFSDELATWACEAEGAAVEMEAEISALRAQLASAVALLERFDSNYASRHEAGDLLEKLRGTL